MSKKPELTFAEVLTIAEKDLSASINHIMQQRNIPPSLMEFIVKSALCDLRDRVKKEELNNLLAFRNCLEECCADEKEDTKAV